MSGFKAQLADPYDADYPSAYPSVSWPIPAPPFQPHSTTSRDAARSIAKHSGHDRQRVLAYLKQHPEGATDEAMGFALGLSGNTLRPRRRELQQAGLVKDSGRYELTASKRRATVWVST